MGRVALPEVLIENELLLCERSSQAHDFEGVNEFRAMPRR
jgi:hypothetical protein